MSTLDPRFTLLGPRDLARAVATPRHATPFNWLQDNQATTIAKLGRIPCQLKLSSR